MPLPSPNIRLSKTTMCQIKHGNDNRLGIGYEICIVNIFEKYDQVIVGLNDSGLILGLCPANERHHYKVMQSLIGWVQT